MNLEQILKHGVYCFQKNDMAAAKEAIKDYWKERNKGAKAFVTVQTNVQGDDIANALLTLINSRLYPYANVNTPPSERCDDC